MDEEQWVEKEVMERFALDGVRGELRHKIVRDLCWVSCAASTVWKTKESSNNKSDCAAQLVCHRVAGLSEAV